MIFCLPVPLAAQRFSSLQRLSAPGPVQKLNFKLKLAIIIVIIMIMMTRMLTATGSAPRGLIVPVAALLQVASASDKVQ
jgi:hypothetical protein